LDRLRHWLSENALDAVLIASRQNKLPHLGIVTSSGYVLITPQQAHILVDFRYFADIADRVKGYQLHLLDATQTMPVLVNRLLAAEHLTTLGFEGEHVSWQTGNQWREALDARLVSLSLDPLR